jgi:signal transduction histidine kinase/CheY-like chemotaxis protein
MADEGLEQRELVKKLAEAQRTIAELRGRIEAQPSDDTDASYHALFKSVPDVVLTLDSDQRITVCNHGAEQALGRPAAELQGNHVAALFEPNSGKALVDMCRTGFEGAGQSEVSLLDGRTMGFSITRVDDERLHLVLREVSPIQLLRTEVANTRRMASVGQLAGGIAHEVNNPLAVIQGRIEMLRAVPDMPPDMRERHFDVLEEHCRRVARIVQNLHSFARPRVPDPDWLGVAGVFDAALERLGRRVERIRVERNEAPELQVYADAQQLEQVMVNLINLAIDSSPEGGKVSLMASSVDGGAVRIEVSDEGYGLDEQLLVELRAPYAAGSAPIDAGRGLALAVSWGIVQEHSGWLTAEAREPRGTLVQLQLPSPSAEEAVDIGRGATQSWVVLVVDDDRIMCETVGWMLTTDGHRIVTAHTAEQALALVGEEDFDFVVTDLRLPGMDGEALIDALRSGWPKLVERTILTSGLLYRPRDPSRYLQKPFTRAQLLKALRAC